MAQKNIYFVCSECGCESLRWAGQCPSCHTWNTLKEFAVERSVSSSGSSRHKAEAVRAYKLSEIDGSPLERIKIDMPLVAEVLGGGIVQGSLLLLGGNPGVGKSTLMLALVHKTKATTLYVSGEESLQQVKDRARRISKPSSNVLLLCDTDIDVILATVLKEKAQLVVIDSIQTVIDRSISSTAGSLVQVREIALRLQQFAKANNISFLLVGHVTKEGSIAGPKILEHIVDGVFYMESESESLRLLRSAKNRYGSTQEIALLEMDQNGISEVAHPEAVFLEGRASNLAGSCVTSVVEGSRVLLVEIQALVVPTVFGYPRRSAVGIHPQRLELILAVLERRAKISLRNYDVFVKATAGLAAREASADLAVAVSLVSAYQNKPVDDKWCVFGEVGLLGEIKQPKDKAIRTKAAKSMGMAKQVSAKNITGALEEILMGRK